MAGVARDEMERAAQLTAIFREDLIPGQSLTSLAEEWVCNFIADYGAKIFSIAYSVLGNDAWMFIPYELDKVIA
jgi:hypothetical protein